MRRVDPAAEEAELSPPVRTPSGVLCQGIISSSAVSSHKLTSLVLQAPHLAENFLIFLAVVQAVDYGHSNPAPPPHSTAPTLGTPAAAASNGYRPKSMTYSITPHDQMSATFKRGAQGDVWAVGRQGPSGAVRGGAPAVTKPAPGMSAPPNALHAPSVHLRLLSFPRPPPVNYPACAPPLYVSTCTVCMHTARPPLPHPPTQSPTQPPTQLPHPPFHRTFRPC